MARSGNPNPWIGRYVYAKTRQAGNAQRAQLTLWKNILTLVAMIEQADNGEDRLRALALCNQALGTYAKMITSVELESRIAVIEESLGIRRVYTRNGH